MDSEKIINEFKHEIDTFVPCCTSDEKHLDVMKAVFDAYQQKEAMLDKICSTVAEIATDVGLNNFSPEYIKEWLENTIEAKPEN